MTAREQALSYAIDELYERVATLERQVAILEQEGWREPVAVEYGGNVVPFPGPAA